MPQENPLLARLEQVVNERRAAPVRGLNPLEARQREITANRMTADDPSLAAKVGAGASRVADVLKHPDIGDDATAGVWELNFPIGSFGNPGDPATIVAPDHQHTPGIDGEFCYDTGGSCLWFLLCPSSSGLLWSRSGQ